MNLKYTKKLKNEWIKALRKAFVNGDSQCRFELHNGNGACCAVGILNKVVAKKLKKSPTQTTTKTITMLPDRIWNLVTHRNDWLFWSFDQIATYLELECPTK